MRRVMFFWFPLDYAQQRAGHERWLVQMSWSRKKRGVTAPPRFMVIEERPDGGHAPVICSGDVVDGRICIDRGVLDASLIEQLQMHCVYYAGLRDSKGVPDIRRAIDAGLIK